VQVTAPNGCQSLKPKAEGESDAKDTKDNKPSSGKEKPEAIQCAKQQPIQTGIQAGDQIQVTSGLQAGQTIIATGAYGLPDGTQVTVQNVNQAPAAESGADDKDAQDKPK
jgi:hypothetical protein